MHDAHYSRENSTCCFKIQATTTARAMERLSKFFIFNFDCFDFSCRNTVKFDNKPWAYICSKGVFAGLIFGGAYFRRGLLLEGILHFKMGWGLE